MNRDCKPHAQVSACTGKCKSGGCNASRTWVIAACEGMLSLLEKREDGRLDLLPLGKGMVAPSIGYFQQHMSRASHDMLFTQLIIVGSANDISWTKLALPDNAANKVIAEVQYPLIPQWFKRPENMKRLADALAQLFQA